MKIDTLGKGVVYGLVAFAALNYMGGSALALIRDAAAGRGMTGMTTSSYANTEGAHITLTNMSAHQKRACWRGIVKSKTGAIVRSHIVCTGTVEPFSSVHQTSPFPVGDVLSACNKMIGENKVLDWSGCTFTTEDMTPSI